MHEVVVFVEEAFEGVVVPIGIDKGNRVGCIVALGVEECGCRCHEDGYEQRGGQVVWSRIQGVGGVWLIAEEADEFGCIGFGHGDVVDAWVSDFCVDALGCTPEGAYLAKVDEEGTVAAHQPVGVAKVFYGLEGVAQTVAHQFAIVVVGNGDVVAGRLEADDPVRTHNQLHIPLLVGKAHHAGFVALDSFAEFLYEAFGLMEPEVAVSHFGNNPIEQIGYSHQSETDEQHAGQEEEVFALEVE